MSDDAARAKPSPAEAPAADGAGAAADANLLSAPPSCWGCQNPIDGGSAIQFADGVWHIECFQCTTCSKVIEFDSNLLFLADGKPICPECSYCCSLCKKPIFDEAIVTVEGTYHSECFRCTNCKKRIQGKSFAKTSQGIIYCVGCYAERRERKKAARRRREHQIVEEKVLPQLPSEAATTTVPSPRASANPLSAGSAVTSPPTTASPTAAAEALSPQQRMDARARKRTAHLAGDFSFGDPTARAASPDLAVGHDVDSSPPRAPSRTAARAAAAAAAPAPAATTSSAPTSPTPTSPISDTIRVRAEDLGPVPPLPPLPSPHGDSLVPNPDIDASAGMEWTEDISALERNFVRLSMRRPPNVAAGSDGSDTSGAFGLPKGDDESDGRAGAFQGPHRRAAGMQRAPALKRATSIGKSQRTRAASSSSMLGNMVPPGLRSSRAERPAPAAAAAKPVPDEAEKAWLDNATVDQLKEELLVNYGQLCRLEVSYQKLRDLYATVINQMLESREALQLERAKRAEYEHILRNYYGYVPPEASGADFAAKPKQRSAGGQSGSASTGGGNAQGGLAAALQSTPTGGNAKSQQQPQPQQPPPQLQPQQALRSRLGGAGSGAAPSAPTSQVSRYASQRRPRPARRSDAPSAVTDHIDSGSDAEDAIITTAPQKATKRFIWPFGGGSSSSTAAAAGRPGPDEHPQHNFQVTSTFRTGRCDHCQERLKTFAHSVVRCRNCGFVCHQRCSANVTASCGTADHSASRGRLGAQPAAAAGAAFAEAQPIDEMFGRDLVQQAEIEGQTVPWIVRAAVAFIEIEGIDMEGVYRRSGSTVDISTVQAEISRISTFTGGRFDDLSATIASPDMDVTSVTSVLKQYFRSLPNPLMTEATYQLWIQAAHIASAKERIKVYRTISDSMPAPHGETLRFLMQHLQRISRNQQENKMTTNNLSVVFAPNILHMAKENMLLEMANMSEINKTVSFLIEHADEVWADAPKQVVESTATAVDSALGPAPVPSFQLPPMNRHTEMSPFNLGAIAAMSPMVLSSPNSPANHRGNREHAGNSGALEVPRSARRNSAADGAADGASSLSRSMPSPDHLPFGMPPAFLPRLNGRDSDAPPRASIDMSRLMK